MEISLNCMPELKGSAFSGAAIASLGCEVRLELVRLGSGCVNGIGLQEVADEFVERSLVEMTDSPGASAQYLETVLWERYFAPIGDSLPSSLNRDQLADYFALLARSDLRCLAPEAWVSYLNLLASSAE